MLFLHEVHQVAGRREEEFEAMYRDGWMPSLAKGDDARLLYFLHHAHGTGRAYNVVTLTAIRDGAAWEQLMLRLHDGDLQPWARDVDQLRHEVAAKMLVPVPWSPLKELDLAAVPTSGQHRLTLFMEAVNLLNRHNVRFALPSVNRRTFEATGLYETMIPLVPSVGILLEF